MDDLDKVLSEANKGFMLTAFVTNLKDDRNDDEIREICLEGVFNMIPAAEYIFSRG